MQGGSAVAKRKNAEWYKYQEEICDYFKSLGVFADTNIRLKGDKTNHDIDVLVQTAFLGQNLKWVVEVKKTKSKLSKLHVLALLKIVEFVGADKGFVISESGFQKGAKEAAENTNISLKTFAELKDETKQLLLSELMTVYEKRIELLESRYWSHSKSIRRKYELRHYLADMNDIDFNAYQLLEKCKVVINSVHEAKYPIDLDTIMNEKVGELAAENLQQVINWLNMNLNWIDEKIILAEVAMISNGDFSPNITHPRNHDLILGKIDWQATKLEASEE